MIRIAAVVLTLFGTQAGADALTRFSENNLIHILAHEIGHAVIREFDVPLLGNEEVIADDFATTWLARALPDRFGEIIHDRALALYEDGDIESEFTEHPSDSRRAGQILCIGFGLNPQAVQDSAKTFGMTGNQAGQCRERASEIARGWRRVLAPLAMPQDVAVTEVRLAFGEGPNKAAIEASSVPDIMRGLLESVDWHSQITLHFDNCEGGANWSRNGRRILVCDDLINKLQAMARDTGRP